MPYRPDMDRHRILLASLAGALATPLAAGATQSTKRALLALLQATR